MTPTHLITVWKREEGEEQHTDDGALTSSVHPLLHLIISPTDTLPLTCSNSWLDNTQPTGNNKHNETL